MFTKKTKRYLMLLAAVGLIAVVAGSGSGTFASFNAEVANTGNSFATGTLVLNDNGGTNTCTSAINNSNSNSTGTNCDTLFKVTTVTPPSATTTAAIVANTTTSVAIGTITNSGVFYKGDSVKITDGTNSDTVTVAATTSGSPLTFTAAPTHAYAVGATITELSPTYLAKLTLTNAGTINASGISFKLANGTTCTSSYNEGHSTLSSTGTSGTSSGSSIAIASITAGLFHSGDPVVVHEGSNYQTFIASGTSTATSIPVTAQTWNATYSTAAVVSGPELNGATSQSLCGNLALSISETTATQANTFSDAAGCAFGGTTNRAASNACDLSGGTALGSLSSNLTALTLTSGGGSGNGATTQLSAGGTRYFVLAVHYTGAAFDNTYQNTKTSSVDLLWHIDQA